jgi:hypothetical protein
MPEPVAPPTPERRPAWRAAALAYRQARREGQSDHAAFRAAVTSLRERWRRRLGAIRFSPALGMRHDCRPSI